MDLQDIRPIAVLEDALEAALLSQVLQDEKIPFYIEARNNSLRTILGEAYYDTLMAPFDGYYGYARVWGRADDGQAIQACLKDVRESRIVDDKPYLVNGRMWRIKKK